MKKSLEKSTVLYIESNPLYAKTTREFLEDAVGEFIRAESAEGAFRFLREHQPEIIFVGVECGEAQPAELAERLEEADGDYKVVLAAKGGNRGKADAIVTPPFVQPFLIETLRKL